MTEVNHRTIRFWCMLILIVEVTSEKIYASIGEDLIVQCPNVKVANWQFSETKETLAVCNTEMNAINPKSKRYNRLNITGTCSLQIQNFTRDDVGIYSCFRLERNNSSKYPYEKNIQLRLEPRVAIKVFPSSTVKTGQKIEIVCHYTSGKSVNMEQIAWYHNGKLLQNTSNKLVFDHAKPAYAGKYNCTATNPAGKVDAVVDIIVNNLPPVEPADIRYVPYKQSIYLEWTTRVDGDGNQTFVVQYRKKMEGDVKYVKLESSRKQIQSYYLENLESNTEYKLRMYAYNKFGNSSFTKEHSIFTRGKISDEMKSSNAEYSFVLVLLLPVCLFGIWWHFRKAKKHDANNSSVENGENIQHVQGGAIENNLYGSGNDLNWSSSASANRTDLYSSIDRRRQILDRQNVSYNITAVDKGRNSADRSELNDVQKSKINRNKSSAGLNYIEVEFDATNQNSKFHVHGADNRRPYADIDFSVKADPLPSSDDSDNETPSHAENDFASLEDVQQWRIHE